MVIPFNFESEDNVTPLHPTRPEVAPLTPLADDPVLQLSPTLLVQLFGYGVAEQAFDLYRLRHVRDLARGPNGEVLAWVDDEGEQVPVLVASQEDVLIQGCGCPVGGYCAHIVGLLLAIRETIARGIEPPVVAADDPRLTLLAAAEALSLQESSYGPSTDDEAYDSFGEEYGADELEPDDVDDDLGFGAVTAIVDHPAASRAALPPHLRDIHQFLDECPPEEQRTTLWELAMLYPPVQSALRARQRLATGDVAAVVAEAREEIERSRDFARGGLLASLSTRPPDYPALLDRLGLLRRRGEVRALAELGRALVRSAPGSPSFLPGPATWIQAALLLVIDSLADEDLPPAEKAEWAVSALLDDKAGILPDLDSLVRVELDQRTWSKLATRLVKRIYSGGIPAPRKPEELQRQKTAPDPVRMRVARLAARLLTNAGDRQRAEQLLIAEAHQRGAVLPLLLHLRDAGRTDEAIRWARAGLDALRDAPPDVYDALLEQLRAIVVDRADWPLLASLWFDELLRQPNARVFRELRSASERAGVWETVRGGLLRYFETGERAWLDRNGRPAPTWPLPPSLRRSPVPSPAPGGPGWPRYGDLIEIAILEGNPDEALALYRRWQRHDGEIWPPTVVERLAAAVTNTHPEEAAELWTGLGLAKVAEGTVPAYQLAGVYLAEAGFVHARQGRRAAWEQGMTKLAEQNRRKHQLRKILKEVVWQVAGGQ